MARWLISAFVVALGCETSKATPAPEPIPNVSPACEKLCRLMSAEELGEHRGGTWLDRMTYSVKCRETIEDYNAKHGGKFCSRALRQMEEF